MRRIVWCIFLFGCVYGCGDSRREVKEVAEVPLIFPDYREVTIPVNIAPLNFGVPGAGRVEVEFRRGTEILMTCRGKGKIDIPLKKWHTLLQEHKGDTLQVKVYACEKGKWTGYLPFPLVIVADSVDPWVAYRLIEPGYELGKRLGLYQRDLSSFEERAFVPPALTENSCVNCHAFCNYSPERFMFHVRWGNPGTIIADSGNIRRVNTRTAGVISPGAYRMWHPSGRYIAFSNNNTYQSFHAFSEKKIEVYDLASGLMIYDVLKNKVWTDSRMTDPQSWKTFPAWSPDGKYLYFCEAVPKVLPDDYKNLKYRLCRVAFDESRGMLADSAEVIPIPEGHRKSVSFPTVSPDGKYLLYTAAACGTFPIWHKEADLEMVALDSGLPVDIRRVNSEAADSYHAWSSSGRWIIFSSRRMDNLYTCLYLAYFDSQGRVHKPFVLPQRDPGFYKRFLKSYNIPEFLKGPVTVSPYQLEKIMKGKVQSAS